MVTVALVAGSPAGGATQAHTAKLSPPLIRESFTPLPCTGKPNSRTTVQQEGCAEHQILATDSRINALAKSIFSRLRDALAQRRFIAAARAWLNYRHADCLSLSDVDEGGSQAPVTDAQCTASRNGQRIKDLRKFLGELSG